MSDIQCVLQQTPTTFEKQRNDHPATNLVHVGNLGLSGLGGWKVVKSLHILPQMKKVCVRRASAATGSCALPLLPPSTCIDDIAML